jgi:hypothetical protein
MATVCSGFITSLSPLINKVGDSMDAEPSSSQSEKSAFFYSLYRKGFPVLKNPD